MTYKEFVLAQQMCGHPATVEGVPPLTLPKAMRKPLKSLNLLGNTLRTIEIDGTEYEIPSGYALLDNSGSTATAYYCKRDSDSATGTLNLTTGVFTASTFTAGSELPTPEYPLGVKGVGDKTENILNDKNIATAYNATGNYIYVGHFGFQVTYDSYTPHINYRSCHCVLPAGTYTFWTDMPNAYLVRYSVGSTITSIAQARQSYTFTITEETEVQFCWRNTSSTSITDDFNTMIVEGSTAPSSYIPYGYKFPIKLNGSIIGTAYRSRQFLKLGTSADLLGIVSGADKVRIAKKVFDGTESWTGSSYFMLVISEMIDSIYGQYICSHFTTRFSSGDRTRDIQFGSNNTTLYIFEHTSCPSGVTDLATWKAYLAAQYAAGTPVTVWYPLATETEESGTPVSIKTASGTNYIDCETEVKPSNAIAKYIKK